MNMEQTKRFDIKAGESLSKIKTYLNEIEKFNLMHSNYRDFGQRIKASETVIDTQIEQNYVSYEERDEQLKSIIQSESFKKQMGDGIIPIETFHLLWELHKSLKNIGAWQSYLIDIYRMGNRKMLDTLGETKAIDMERQVLERFAEYQKRNGDLVVEIVNNKVKFLEEKHFHFTERLLKEMAAQMKEMNNGFIMAIKELSVSMPKEKIARLEKAAEYAKSKIPDKIDYEKEFIEEEEEVPDTLPQLKSGSSEKPKEKKIIDKKEEEIKEKEEEIGDSEDLVTEEEEA